MDFPVFRDTLYNLYSSLFCHNVGLAFVGSFCRCQRVGNEAMGRSHGLVFILCLLGILFTVLMIVLRCTIAKEFWGETNPDTYMVFACFKILFYITVILLSASMKLDRWYCYPICATGFLFLAIFCLIYIYVDLLILYGIVNWSQTRRFTTGRLVLSLVFYTIDCFLSLLLLVLTIVIATMKPTEPIPLGILNKIRLARLLNSNQEQQNTHEEETITEIDGTDEAAIIINDMRPLLAAAGQMAHQ